MSSEFRGIRKNREFSPNFAERRGFAEFREIILQRRGKFRGTFRQKAQRRGKVRGNSAKFLERRGFFRHISRNDFFFPRNVAERSATTLVVAMRFGLKNVTVKFDIWAKNICHTFYCE